MPLHKLTRTISPNLLPLVSELADEWRSPRSDKSAEPVIFEIDPGQDEPVRVYVVWSKWQAVAPMTRSDVILDACEAVRGKDWVMRVDIAAGLTPDEARDMGLEGFADTPDAAGDQD